MDDEPRSAQRYLEDLTPGGSEYFNNPKRCYEWAYGRIEGAHQIALDAALERNRQCERAVKAEAALRAALIVLAPVMFDCGCDACGCGKAPEEVERAEEIIRAALVSE
jgi:hypothetical protein